MSQERWDVDLKVLNGPMASLGVQVRRGPVVRIGVNPGPTGFALSGYRGVDARHCVITIYGEGEATVAPVGSNQVRAAPHPHVDWSNIDPIRGPEFINKGGALHLGPVGRGCIIEFVGSRRVGQWTEGGMSSEAARVEAASVATHARQEVRKVGSTSGTIRNIAVKGAPIWILGCMSLMLVTAMSVVLGVIFLRPPAPMEMPDLPVAQQREFYEEVNPKRSKLVEKRLSGFNDAFYQFVAEPNANHAATVGNRANIDEIVDPEKWDQELLEYIVASFEVHARSPIVLKKLDSIKDHYLTVLIELRNANPPLPDVFAGIPYLESRYSPRALSNVCALGWWQFMPEYGHRAQRRYGMDFKVSQCPIYKDGSSEPIMWDPRKSTPRIPAKKSDYVNYQDDKNYGCAIRNGSLKGVCKQDDRVDLAKSTRLAIRDFHTAWKDKELAASGAAVQATIMSHNAGYDASVFGEKKPKYGNMIAAYRRHKKKTSANEYHKFYGMNLRCKKSETKDECKPKSVLYPRVQHYGYPIIAEHFLAACYYGINYANKHKIFEEYRDKFGGTNGYCNQLKIKTKQELGLK